MQTVSTRAVEKAIDAASHALLHHGVIIDVDMRERAEQALIDLLSEQVVVIDAPEEHDRVYIQRERRIHAIAKDTATYYVQQAQYQDALDACDGDEEAALIKLSDDGLLQRDSYQDYSVEVEDVTEEHNVEFSMG